MNKRIDLGEHNAVNYLTTNERGLFYLSLFIHKELSQGQADELALLIENAVLRYVEGVKAS